jgi:ribonuclease-3
VFGHAFKDAALCRAALTHRSAGGEHNERLEFLGDAVLNCSVARLLYDAHPDADEGALSRLRASLVRGETLAQIAGDLQMGEHLRLGSGELRSGGYRRASILADALEAMVGAIFLDSDFDAAAAAVARILGGRLQKLPPSETLKDAKTRLQEVLQGRGLGLPVYVLTAAAGEPHAQSFTVTCEVPTFGLIAVGEGASRRRAEQLAARKVLDQLPPEMRKSP